MDELLRLLDSLSRSDTFWRIVSISALVLVCYRPLRFGYKRLRHRLAYGVWPPKTKEEIEMEVGQRKSSERFLEDADYHANPFMPGSMARASIEQSEVSERMSKALKSFDDR